MNHPPGLWTRRDRLIVAVLNACAFIAILGGWVWASGLTELEAQFPATNVAAVGLMAAMAANLAWLLAGRRALAQAKRALFEPYVDGP